MVTRYQGEFDIPMNMEPEDLSQFIEALREFGYPKIVFRVEAADKEEAVTEVANSTSVWWLRGGRYTKEWWSKVIRNVRREWTEDEWPRLPERDLTDGK